MDDNQRWKDAARSFESSLMILRKDKNGWVIGFSVHPDEAPTDLLDAALGTRFRQVLFQIGDDEQPVRVRQPASLIDLSAYKENPVAEAGKLCRDKEFQAWVVCKINFPEIDPEEEEGKTCVKGFVSEAEKSPEIFEEVAANFLRDQCGVQTRKEFAENQEALDIFVEIKREFREFQMSL